MASATGFKKINRHNFDLDERNPNLKNGVRRTSTEKMIYFFKLVLPMAYDLITMTLIAIFFSHFPGFCR